MTLSGAAVAVMLLISLVTDLRNRKILNVVTLPAMLFGIVYHTFASGVSGFSSAGLGLLLGLGLLIVPYLMGGMGAGDVKLLAAVGAWCGPAFVYQTFVFTAIAGGAIAAVILTARGEWRNSLKRIGYGMGALQGSVGSLQALDRQELHHAIPYAVPIAIGACAAWLWGGVLP